jgi:hypothetical protein
MSKVQRRETVRDQSRPIQHTQHSQLERGGEEDLKNFFDVNAEEEIVDLSNIDFIRTSISA